MPKKSEKSLTPKEVLPPLEDAPSGALVVENTTGSEQVLQHDNPAFTPLSSTLSGIVTFVLLLVLNRTFRIVRKRNAE